ncbi:hypothetical protein EBR66_02130 [bacterium]|nr:hypothetical protein [bacterium]
MKQEYTQDSWWYTGEPERMRIRARSVWRATIAIDVCTVLCVIVAAFAYYDASQEFPVTTNTVNKATLTKLFDKNQLQVVLGAFAARAERYQALTKTYPSLGEFEN